MLILLDMSAASDNTLKHEELFTCLWTLARWWNPLQWFYFFNFRVQKVVLGNCSLPEGCFLCHFSVIPSLQCVYGKLGCGIFISHMTSLLFVSISPDLSSMACPLSNELGTWMRASWQRLNSDMIYRIEDATRGNDRLYQPPFTEVYACYLLHSLATWG